MSCLFKVFRSASIMCGLKRPNSVEYHTLSLPELEGYLQTSIQNGLTTHQASTLYRQNGANKITPYSENKFLKIMGYFMTGFCGTFNFKYFS